MKTVNSLSDLRKRLEIFDLLRGHFLISMFFGHLSYYVGNSLFTAYEGNSSLWVSPAEGFIFLSGFFCTYIYLPKLLNGSFTSVLKSLWKKAIEMYFLSVFLTVIYTLVGVSLGKAPYVGNGLMYSGVLNLIRDALSLEYNYSWADIIMLYVPFFLVSPFILLAFKHRLKLIVLFISFIIWLQSFGKLSCSGFCISFFNVYAWQFLFILGMFIADSREIFISLHSMLVRNLLLKLSFFIVCLLLVILSVLDVFYKYFDPSVSKLIRMWVNKENIATLRIILFLYWFGVLYLFFERFKNFFVKKLGFIYLTFGSHSLLTYILQSVILFVFFYFPLRFSFWLNTLYESVAMIILIILVYSVVYLRKYRSYLYH